MMLPSELPIGTIATDAIVPPPKMIESARGTSASGTSRMAMAATNDHDPPTTMPRSIRPNSRIGRLGGDGDQQIRGHLKDREQEEQHAPVKVAGRERNN